MGLVPGNISAHLGVEDLPEGEGEESSRARLGRLPSMSKSEEIM
jgi:hypothetical protein